MLTTSPSERLRRRRNALNRPAAPPAPRNPFRVPAASPAPPTATFLGCGIHAAYDGNIVIVRLAAKSGDQHLYLEPRTLRSLLLGAAEVAKRQALEPEPGSER